MVTHISLFTLAADPQSPQGKQDAARVKSLLEKVPEQLEGVVSSTVGVCSMYAPIPLPPGGPTACDLAQILVFQTPAQAAAYPTGEAHQALVKATEHLISSVYFIDFEG